MAKDFGLSWSEGGNPALVGDNFVAVRSGYLRKSPADVPVGPWATTGLTYRLKAMKKWERRWFVFGVSLWRSIVSGVLSRVFSSVACSGNKCF